MSEDSVRYNSDGSRIQQKRPIVPRVERARRSLSWFVQAALIEGWDALPEFKKFEKAGMSLIEAIDKGGKNG